MKKTFLSILIAAIFALCACTDKKTETVTADLNNAGTADILPVGESSDDSQNYWGTVTHNFAKGEGCYYYMDNNGKYLMFFDESSKESYPLCALPDCSHDSITCNAYIGTDAETGYLMETVYYYKGNIYLLNSKGELVRFSADGSQRESVAQVYEYGQGDTGTNLVFHDNAVYVYNINEHLGSSETYTETITRYLLDGKEKAVVVQYTGTSSAIMQAKCFGNQLTFLVSEVQKQTADGKILLSQEYKGLYVYRTDTGVAGKVIDEPVSGYCVDEKNSILYYFVKGKGLYSYDCNTKERKMLLEAEADNQMPELSFDGTYIYMDNSTWVSLAKRSGQEFEKKCIVLDKEGNVVNTIPCDRVSRIYFGDSQYIFANISQMISDDIKSSYGYINKSDITSASEWTPMY